MARNCFGNVSCYCANAAGETIGYNPTADSFQSPAGPYSPTPYHQCCIANGVGAGCASMGPQSNPMSALQGVGPVRPVRPIKPTLTGQSVNWRKQSGESEGGLFGLSTTQLLIAGAVGVGAYLILKKRKK